MFRRWAADADRQALAGAVSYVESLSAVELVVTVRRRSRSWPHVPFVAAALAAWTTLAVMMFSAPAFALWSFLVDPFVIGAAVGWAAGLPLSLTRWLTPSAARRKAVNTDANSAFVERRAHGTRGRTGVLVYCALGERMAAVVVDAAVAAAVAPSRLAAWRDEIERALGRGASPTADAIGAMAPVFAAMLPRLDDDVNELPDGVEHDIGGSEPL
jgi:putative membrane protein